MAYPAKIQIADFPSIRDAGLTRCCTMAIADDHGTRNAPPIEGETLRCTRCSGLYGMIFHDGAWESNAPKQWMTPDNFAGGWNARCRGEAYDTRRSPDWQEAWKACDAYPEKERVQYNRPENVARYQKASELK